MDHWARIEAAVAGRAVDRIPVALWRHFPHDDQDAGKLAARTLEWQRAWDFDLVKFMPSGTYSVEDWGAKSVFDGAANGVVEAYLHRTGDYPPQVGVLVEINCESDFVAKGDNFRQLARELAIHIAAAKPRWINPEDVPEDVLDAERQIHAKRFESEGKPAAQIPKIVEGQINAFYKDNCLMKQLWVRDNKTPIENLVKENISRLQENIVVRRFARFDVKEA